MGRAVRWSCVALVLGFGIPAAAQLSEAAFRAEAAAAERDDQLLVRYAADGSDRLARVAAEDTARVELLPADVKLLVSVATPRNNYAFTYDRFRSGAGGPPFELRLDGTRSPLNGWRRVVAMSALSKVERLRTIALLQLHGARDIVTTLDQTKAFRDRMLDANPMYTFIEVPAAGHGLLGHADEYFAAADVFLSRCLVYRAEALTVEERRRSSQSLLSGMELEASRR